MRRLAALLTVLALVVPGEAPAQRVGLEVLLDTTRPPVPIVLTPGILRDSRWLQSIQNAFPLRMEFRLELWRVRPDWFDALERAFEWKTIVQYEPLNDQYAVTDIWSNVPRPRQRAATLRELEAELEGENRILVRARAPGEYYYTVTLQISTMTESELDEMERFLQGGGVDDPRRGSALGRRVRQWLLRIGGLPQDRLEARSARFVVSR